MLNQDEPSQKLTSNSPVPLFHLTIDNLGFLTNGNAQRVIWVPAHLRASYSDRIYARANTVVIGGRSGAITFIRFNPDSC